MCRINVNKCAQVAISQTLPIMDSSEAPTSDATQLSMLHWRAGLAACS